MEAVMVTIRLNGQSRSLPQSSTVAALLSELGFSGQPVLVEVNGEAVFPRHFDGAIFREGDVVEVIRIVAGG